MISLAYYSASRKPASVIRIALVPAVDGMLERSGHPRLRELERLSGNPDVHVALMRYWHEKYGAELMTLTRDVVEMSVARPPMTREDALELAKEKFLYCQDILTQGTQTLERLAAEHLGCPVWFFWWD